MPSQVDIPTRLLEEFDLERAAAQEIEAGVPDLPSRSAEHAVRGAVGDYAERLRAEFARPFSLTAAEIVWAPKARLRHRPIAMLDFSDRVLLTSLSQLISTALPDYEGAQPTYAEFLFAPLRGSEAWVLSADVASFFQYVDHALVADRIIATTARADVAQVTSSLLGGAMDRTFGLPQGLSGSRVLANLAIAPVEWRLADAGLNATRHVDDVRIACGSATEGAHALGSVIGRQASAGGRRCL